MLITVFMVRQLTESIIKTIPQQTIALYICKDFRYNLSQYIVKKGIMKVIVRCNKFINFLLWTFGINKRNYT